MEGTESMEYFSKIAIWQPTAQGILIFSMGRWTFWTHVPSIRNVT